MSGTSVHRSRLGKRLATWAVVCFGLAFALYLVGYAFALGATGLDGSDGLGGFGAYGFLAISGIAGNPLGQALVWLGLVFTAGSVGAHVAAEAVDRAAGLRTGPPAAEAPASGPEEA